MIDSSAHALRAATPSRQHHQYQLLVGLRNGLWTRTGGSVACWSLPRVQVGSRIMGRQRSSGCRVQRAHLLTKLMPKHVRVCEVFGDLSDRADSRPHPSGEAQVSGRALEFITGRCCAASAMSEIGVTGHVGVGAHREPLWPEGVVGSITHSGMYRAAAVARREYVSCIGIDVQERTPDAARAAVHALRVEELRRAPAALDSFGTWSLLTFSAKESIYKAWYPRTAAWLDFLDVEVLLGRALRGAGSFTCRPATSAAVDKPLDLPTLRGRFLVDSGYVATVVLLATPDAMS